MKRLTRMLAATVDGRAVMVMQAEGEAPVAYDLGAEKQAEGGELGNDVSFAKDLVGQALGPGTHVIQDLGVAWARPSDSV